VLKGVKVGRWSLLSLRKVGRERALGVDLSLDGVIVTKAVSLASATLLHIKEQLIAKEEGRLQLASMEARGGLNSSQHARHAFEFGSSVMPRKNQGGRSEEQYS